MSPILTVTIIGVLAGIVGTGLGGLICVITCKDNKKTLGFLLAFSAGVMLAVVFADLFPESVELGGMYVAMLGLVIGVIALLLLDLYLPHSHFINSNGEGLRARMIQSSLLLGIGIAMHNFPEGLAIGASYSLSESLGLGLALIIALHNIPEGMAIAGPMRAAGLKGTHILFWSGLAGAPTGLGALVGAWLGSISSMTLSLALGTAAGAMLYISFDELLPQAHELSEGSHAATFGAVAGTVLGLLFVLLLPDV